MANLLLPPLSPLAKAARGWPSSPSTIPNIDARLSNPKGVECAFLFNQINGRHDFAGNRSLSLVNNAHLANGLLLDGTSDYADFSSTWQSGNANTNKSFLIAYETAEDNANRYLTGTSTDLLLNLTTETITIVKAGTDPVWTVSKSLTGKHTLLFTYDYAGAIHEWRLWIDGQYAGLTTGQDGNIAISRLGDRGDQFAEWNGSIFCFVGWGERIPDVAAEKYSRDFLTLFTPANQSSYLYSIPAAAGAPTLSLPTYSSVTADSATVGCTVTF